MVGDRLVSTLDYNTQSCLQLLLISAQFSSRWEAELSGNPWRGDGVELLDGLLDPLLESERGQRMAELLEGILNCCDEDVMELVEGLREREGERGRGVSRAAERDPTSLRSTSSVEESQTAMIFIIVFVQ
jgi:hypothetical protein